MSRTLGRALAMPGWYRVACAVLPVVGWLPLFAFPPMIHGGTLAEDVGTWIGIAFSAYGALEVARRAGRAVRLLAWFGVALYGALLALGLAAATWWAIVYA